MLLSLEPTKLLDGCLQILCEECYQSPYFFLCQCFQILWGFTSFKHSHDVLPHLWIEVVFNNVDGYYHQDFSFGGHAGLSPFLSLPSLLQTIMWWNWTRLNREWGRRPLRRMASSNPLDLLCTFKMSTRGISTANLAPQRLQHKCRYLSVGIDICLTSITKFHGNR